MSKTQSNPRERPSETAKKGLRAKSGEETAEISATAPIRAQEFDPHFKHEVSKTHGGEKLKQCFQCGTCTSDCPIARFSDSYRPRTLIRMTLLGLKDRVLTSETLWLCAACFTCTDRCPQDVEVASVIRILRNTAVEKGYMPQIFKELGSSILETGVAYRIPDLRLKKRAQIGLPPLPKGNPEAMTKLAKATGFSKLLKRGEQA
ncbi:MAG: 4Fe-4S dicluster domain-containing protein [Candidatus Bathyarchaeota archaeon]|nr:MAG: 4Fe-4S dicluster domain-containing protein [Candidatus Bathyarchaeota archaeon]